MWIKKKSMKERQPFEISEWCLPELLFRESGATWGGSSWERDCETEKQREAETQRDRDRKNSSLPQQQPIRAVKKREEPNVKLYSSGGACRFPFAFSLTPLVYILMNQSDYSGRFWSVSVWCFFSTVTVHSVFVISPPWGVFWTTSDSAGCWIKVL